MQELGKEICVKIEIIRILKKFLYIQIKKVSVREKKVLQLN
jgi:hypothetical protein